jgi:hypothetical protein
MLNTVEGLGRSAVRQLIMVCTRSWVFDKVILSVR